MENFRSGAAPTAASGKIGSEDGDPAESHIDRRPDF